MTVFFCAARALARPGARTMALIGNGAQSEFQALAFHHLLGIDTLRLFDTDPAATAKLQANLQGTAGLRTVACTSTRSPGCTRASSRSATTPSAASPARKRCTRSEGASPRRRDGTIVINSRIRVALLLPARSRA